MVAGSKLSGLGPQKPLLNTKYYKGWHTVKRTGPFTLALRAACGCPKCRASRLRAYFTTDSLRTMSHFSAIKKLMLPHRSDRLAIHCLERQREERIAYANRLIVKRLEEGSA